MERARASEEDYYPRLPGTYFEDMPTDTLRELEKFRQMCPYRITMQPGANLIKLRITSFDRAVVAKFVWRMEPASAGTVGNLLDHIRTGTSGTFYMFGGVMIRYTANPETKGMIRLTVVGISIVEIPHCDALGRGLEDIYAILSAL